MTKKNLPISLLGLIVAAFSSPSINAATDTKLTITGQQGEHCLTLAGTNYKLTQCTSAATPTSLNYTGAKNVKVDNQCFEVRPNMATYSIEIIAATCQDIPTQKLELRDNRLAYGANCITASYDGTLMLDHCAASTLTFTQDATPPAPEIKVDDLAWLAYGSAASAYQPVEGEEFGPRYVVDGMIMKNWSSTRVNVPGRCAFGLEKSGELCYTPCETGYQGNGPVCWQVCPEGFTDDGAFCRKDRSHAKSSYGRGVGRIPIPGCKPNEEWDAGLCYKKCDDGFDGVGPVCWQYCESGLVDTGAFCQDPDVQIFAKKSHGRGAGKPIILTGYEQVYDTPACDGKGWEGFSNKSDTNQEVITLIKPEQKVAVISFRGTQLTSLNDVFTDLDFTPHTFEMQGITAKVHSGFWRNAARLETELKQALEKIPADYKLVLTGHSLGAAVATVAAVDFAAWGRKPDAVITFASPLVGDDGFKQLYQKVIGCEQTRRVAIAQDIVTGIPEVYGYTHVCDALSADYISDPLSTHDLFLGYAQAMETIFGNQKVASNAYCPAFEAAN